VDSIVTYSAVLDVREETVFFLARLLWLRRRELGTRRGRRAPGCCRQAVMVIRWYLDGTRIARLATDNAIGASTAYRYLHEGIDASPRPPRTSIRRSPRPRPQVTSISTSTARWCAPTGSPAPGPTARTCGGPGSTDTTAGTSRCCPTPTAGRCGFLTSDPDGNTT
jgi:hypothetical protein